MPLIQGQVLQNRYRIAQLIEQGGFGAIYRAWDIVLARACALKENLDASPEAGRQFEREAKILADLSHPNLPRVTDHFFIPGQGQYLVMDLVEGQDLQSMLEDHGSPMNESRVLPWIEQVCDALAYLHAQQPAVIHRDIKPANIQITPQGKAMLVDFGIAKIYDPKLKTTIGARAVTPGFSPYEQYGHGRTDERTDIYALGATIYTLLCGQEPPESVQRIVRDPLKAPNQINPLLSPHTNAAIMRALQMDPVLRFQSANQLKLALRQAPVGGAGGAAKATYPGAKSLPWAQIGAAGLLLLVLALIIFVLNFRLGQKVPVDAPVSQAGAPLTASPSGAPTATAARLTPSLTPTPELDTPQNTPMVYRVQPGDICSNIARQFGVSTESIIALNHLDAGCSIQAGQTLLILDPPQTPEISATLPPTNTLELWTAGDKQRSPVDNMEMVYVPAGAFLMGAPADDLSARSNEEPQT
ncbi:protein kinase, partial [Chloroflexota bacterium]